MDDIHWATCDELFVMAQCELVSFIAAVSELFGTELARCSAEDWLDELGRQDGVSYQRLRQVTVGASAQLTTHLPHLLPRFDQRVAGGLQISSNKKEQHLWRRQQSQ